MTDRSRFLWISASPSLKYFHRRLIRHLSQVIKIKCWEFYQSLDESSSIDEAVELLHTHLKDTADPVHLIGHGMGGIIALVYARTYPSQVASLTLLSVAARPGINWHSYYYDRLCSLSDNRKATLTSLANDLFPDRSARHVCDLVERLERDLVESPSNHSLFQSSILPSGGVEMPLMICASQSDPVIKLAASYGWNNYLKPIDRIWHISTGGHFFHHMNSEVVSYQIQKFWQELEPEIAFHQLLKVELN
ncbi:alpha/beta hydrolase [Chamaesiphon sp. OTE_20_metabat_361]|uniref:alpha/beta fold hydrolase n=1 Tax=Chamaesiphon sp. OTE_20_metabat_361 TaxID=2964689 RepID=UPI002869FEB4|nr:alpha/beta hydrolase [Chamaesiphon sp. OTE_20_metabat_361]